MMPQAPAWAALLSAERLIPLLLGLAYILARLGLAWAAQRSRLAEGWLAAGRALGALASMAALWWTLTQGWLAGLDAGLGWPERAFYAGRLPLILALGAGWLALLWGGVWWQMRPQAPLARATGWGGLPEWPTHALSREAGLALLRASVAPACALVAPLCAAVAPLAGVSWGPWLAGALLAATDWPWLRGASPERLSWRLLALALDALSTGLYVVSGALWPGLIARVLLSLVLAGIYGLARRRGRQAA